MALQGDISLDCIAADPYSRYLYGIRNASDILGGSNFEKYHYITSSILIYNLVRLNTHTTRCLRPPRNFKSQTRDQSRLISRYLDHARETMLDF